MRAHFDADVIAALRGKVITHNEACPEKTRLQELKKIYADGWRGPSPETEAMAAVDRHLLAKAGEYDEADHPRANNGKFRSKGGAFSNVRTEEAHRAEVRDNAGYRALQTDVIPENRFTAYTPSVLAAGAAGLAAATGAFPEGKDPIFDNIARPVLRTVTNAAGQVIGRTGASVATASTQIAANAINSVLPKGSRKLSVLSQQRAGRIVDATGDFLGHGAAKVVDSAARLYQYGTVGINRAIVNNAAGPPIRGDGFRANLARTSRQVRGRGMGALYGVLNPLTGGAFIASAYKAGEYLGPLFDAYSPRRVEKVEGAGIDELLAKAASGASAEDLAKAVPLDPKLVARFAAGAVGNTIKAGRRMFSAGRPFGPVSQTLGAAAGAAVGGAAAAAGQAVYDHKRGNPYHDEDGKFTSKDRATNAGLIGAGVGGLAALAGMRFGNRQAALAVVRRLQSMGAKTESRALSTARAADATYAIREKNARNAKEAGEDALDTLIGDRTGWTLVRQQLDEIRGDRLKGLLRGVGKDGRNFHAGSPEYAAGGAQRDAYMKRFRAAADRLRDGNEVDFQAGKLLSPEQQKLFDHERNYLAQHRAEAEAKVQGFFGRGPAIQARQKEITEAIAEARKERVEQLGGVNGLIGDIRELAGSVEQFVPEVKREKILALYTKYAKVTGAAPKLPPKTSAQKQIEHLETQAQAAVKTINGNTAAKTDALEAEAKKLSGDYAEWEKTNRSYTGLASSSKDSGSGIAIEHPYERGELLPTRLTPTQIAERRKAINDTTIGRFQADQQGRNSQVREATRARFARAMAAVRGQVPAVVPTPRAVDRAFQQAMAVIAPSLDRAQRDVLKAISSAQRSSALPDVKTARQFLFGAAESKAADGKVIAAIPNVLQRALQSAVEWKQWIREHAKEGVALAGLATAAGILDVSSDGKLDFKGFSKLLDGQVVPDRYFQIFNAGTKEEVVVWGATVKTGDGKSRFVYADAYWPNNKDRTTAWEKDGGVTPNSLVGDIENVMRNRGGGQGGQGPAIRINNPDNAKKINEAKGAIGRIGKGIRTEHSADDREVSVRYRAGFDNVKNEDQEVIRNGARALSQEMADNIRTATDVTAKLGIALSGQDNAGALLDASQRAGLITRVMGQDVHSAFHAKDGQKLRTAVETWVRGAGQGAPPRQVVRALHMLNVAANKPISANDMAASIRSIESAAPVTKVPEGASGIREPDTARESSGPIFADDDGWRKHKIPTEVFNQTWTDVADDIRRLNNPFGANPLDDHAIKSRIGEAMRLAYHYNTTEKDDAKRWEDARKHVIAQIRSGAFFGKADSGQLGEALRKVFDENKIRRNPRGADTGGEFSSKGGAQSPAQPMQAQAAPQADNRSFFEPNRLLGAVGSTAAMQMAWDIADRILPNVSGAPAHIPPGAVGMGFKMATSGKKIVRFGTQLAASILGGAAGQAGGEAVADAGYQAAGIPSPGSYTPPDRSGGETTSRIAGQVGGWMAGSKIGRGYAGKLIASIAGSMAGEEVAGAAHRYIVSNYGNNIAATVKQYL